MPITHSKTMLVRLPVEIAEQLKKLRNDKNLSTIGVALKYWIEQQTNERIDTRLNSIEEQIKKLSKIADGQTNTFVGMDNLLDRILNLLLKANQRFEVLEKVK